MPRGRQFIMATVVSSFNPAQPERFRSFVLPREHGAWGMLLIPLMTGAAVGFASGHAALPLVLFAAAALSIFGLRTPVEAWVGASALRPATPAERRVVLYSIFSYAAVATLTVGWLLFHEKALGLIFIGAAAAIIFGLQASIKSLGRPARMAAQILGAVGLTSTAPGAYYIFGLQASIKSLGRPARMAAQILGAVGLTSTAPGAYYVVTGSLDQQAMLLWALNWLFAANQIHFVQVRIRGARAAKFPEKFALGRWFLVGEVVTTFLLTTAWLTGLLPGLAALAFVPVLLRGVYWFLEGEKPLVIHRLGFTELAHALAFGVLLILGYLL